MRKKRENEMWELKKEKIIFTGLAARLTSANKQMPAYMGASVATSRLTANQHTVNGRDHLCIVERPDVHIIFPSWCSSEYSLSCVIQHVNYTQVLKFVKNDSLYIFVVTCIRYGISICAFLFLILRCNIINLLKSSDKDAF